MRDASASPSYFSGFSYVHTHIYLLKIECESKLREKTFILFHSIKWFFRVVASILAQCNGTSENLSNGTHVENVICYIPFWKSDIKS